MKKEILLVLCSILFMAMAPSHSPVPVPSGSPHPSPKPTVARAPEPVIDLRLVSFDSPDPIQYQTDFGNYIQHIDFTFSNDGDIEVNAKGQFSIVPSSVAGAPTLLSSMIYIPIAAHTQASWDNFDGLPVYYGPGAYTITLCVYPYSIGLSPVALIDSKPLNNCLVKLYNLTP